MRIGEKKKKNGKRRKKRNGQQEKKGKDQTKTKEKTVEKRPVQTGRTPHASQHGGASYVLLYEVHTVNVRRAY